MALVLEAPTTTEQPAVKLFTEPPAAAAAATLLDGADEGDVGDADEPQRDGAASVTVRLTKEVEDAISAFSGHVGETFDAYIDADGNTWIPLPSSDICLEAEEFEIVEPLADVTVEVAGLLDGSAEEITEVALESVAEDSLPPAVETPPAAATEPAAAVPTPPPAPKPQPSDYEIRRRQYLREKDILQEQISALMIEQAKLKEQAKRCKKEAEVYIDQLNNLIEAWESPAASLENEPPTPTGAPVTVTVATTATESTPAPSAAEPAVDAEQAARVAEINSQAAEQARYQRVLEAAPIVQLGLPAKIQERLEEAGATTVWRLEQLRAEISQGREKWPKGIGEAKITQIEDAIISWMGRNSETWSKGYRDAIAEEVKAETKAEGGETAPPEVDTTPAAAEAIAKVDETRTLDDELSDL